MAKGKHWIRAAWEKFRMGDRLTMKELEELHSSAADAEPILRRHPDMGAAHKVMLMDLNRLDDMLHARRKAS